MTTQLVVATPSRAKKDFWAHGRPWPCQDSLKRVYAYYLDHDEAEADNPKWAEELLKEAGYLDEAGQPCLALGDPPRIRGSMGLTPGRPCFCKKLLMEAGVR